LQCWGQRLFDEDGDAARQEIGRDRVVVDRRRGDHGGGDERQQGAVVVEGARVAALGDQLGLRSVGVGDADEFHVRHPRQDAGVLLPQMPDADHPQPEP